jgi:RNA polymerase sporulation-specific sigma factor
MSLSMLVSAVLAGFPLIFMPSYISDGISFDKPLSKEDEQKYIHLYMNGTDEEKNAAREKLIKHNMRLVAHISKKYANSGISQDDLISTGTIGLIKAVSTYSPERSPRLGTYAARCIENEILMWIRKSRKEKAEISLNEPLGTDKEGNDISFIDILGTDTDLISDDLELKMEIADLYHAIESELKPREKVVIIDRFGLFGHDELTQREIAAKLGISRSYVSRIERRALLKLRHAIVSV